MPTRYETTTSKISTPWGSIYTHVMHLHGEIQSVEISTPGKLENTTIDHILKSIKKPSQLREISYHRDPNINKMFVEVTTTIAQDIKDIKRLWMYWKKPTSPDTRSQPA